MTPARKDAEEIAVEAALLIFTRNERVRSHVDSILPEGHEVREIPADFVTPAQREALEKLREIPAVYRALADVGYRPEAPNLEVVK